MQVQKDALTLAMWLNKHKDSARQIDVLTNTTARLEAEVAQLTAQGWLTLFMYLMYASPFISSQRYIFLLPLFTSFVHLFYFNPFHHTTLFDLI